MRKILLILSIAIFAFVGCEDDKGKLLDPNAMISIRPDASAFTRTSTNPEHLTALEIVEQTTITHNSLGTRGFSDAQRDYDDVRLLMFGTDIIGIYGEWIPDFIESRGTVLEKHRRINDIRIVDTIAYIKNSTLDLAETQIRDALAKEDYETCYAIFNEAFTFLPITGAEYRALEAKGEN